MVVRWWQRILTVGSVLLVLAGVIPIVNLYLTNLNRNLKPLSVPFPPNAGFYSSNIFATDSNATYQIDLVWNGSVEGRKALDFNWRVVDLSGTVIANGVYANELHGNALTLGSYNAKRDVQQRLILVNLRRPMGLGSAHPLVEVERPEAQLDIAYEAVQAYGWAAILAGTGGLILIMLLVRRIIRRKNDRTAVS